MHEEGTLTTSSVLEKVRGDVLPNLSYPSSNLLLKGHCSDRRDCAGDEEF